MTVPHPRPKARPAIRAFRVASRNEELAVLVFQRHSVSARREGAHELGEEFRDVSTLRAPEFDTYSPGPVPFEVMYRHGWWQNCRGCDRHVQERLTESSIDDPEYFGRKGQPLSPVFAPGGEVYCHPDCQAEEQDTQDRRRRAQQDAEQTALEHWPGCQVVAIWIDPAGQRPAHVTLNLPGGNPGQNADFGWTLGEDEVLIAPSHRDAFGAYRQTSRTTGPGE